MKTRLAACLMMAAVFGLAPLGLISADAAPNDVDSHIAAAQKAAGTDFTGTLSRLCIQPANGSDAQASARNASGAAPRPRVIPPRVEWYAEPAQVFDNLYWIGTKVHSAWAIKTSAGLIVVDTLYNYAVEAEMVDGLKKLGLNPADIKYVIITHGHGDHDEGAKLLQDRYGAKIVMGAPDWETVAKATTMAGGIPKKDISVAADQKLTLGDETVSIITTPGHTPGTLSVIFPVKDHGKTLTVAYNGGTAFNFPREPARFDIYINSQKKFQKAVAAAGATILMTNHSEFDDAYVRGRFARKPGEDSPFVIGAAKVQNYFTVAAECAEALKAKLKGS